MLNANMGWLAVTRLGNPLPITTAIQQANGQVEFTVTGDLVPPLAIPGRYNARVSQVNGGRSPLNRALVVDYVNAHTFVTRERIGFNSPETTGQLQPYSRVLTFVPYVNLVLALQTAKHKRGKPFLSEPGRAKKEVRW